MKSDLPLFYYQPNTVDFLEKSVELNKKIFKNLIILQKDFYEPFDSIYKHMCYNHEAFERFCLRRFFVMLEYVKENNIDKFLYSDTDAIFLKLLDFENILGKEHSILCKPAEQDKFDDIAAAHFSIWSRAGLENFCDFVLSVYANNIQIIEPKWHWHISTATGGGICDMTLLYHWYKNKKSLLDYYNGGVFDRTIGISHNNYKNEFVTKDGIKKLKRKDSIVYGTNNKGEEIEFYGVHFQGANKRLMFLL